MVFVVQTLVDVVVQLFVSHCKLMVEIRHLLVFVDQAVVFQLLVSNCQLMLQFLQCPMLVVDQVLGVGWLLSHCNILQYLLLAVHQALVVLLLANHSIPIQIVQHYLLAVDLPLVVHMVSDCLLLAVG